MKKAPGSNKCTADYVNLTLPQYSLVYPVGRQSGGATRFVTVRRA